LIFSKRLSFYIASLLLVAIFGLLFIPVRVNGLSMLPQLHGNQLLPVAPVWLRAPQRGQVVVFEEPDTGTVAVKRVAGMPGERVQIIGGDLFVDGQRFVRQVSRPQELISIVDSDTNLVDLTLGEATSGGDRMLRALPYDGFLLAGNFSDGIMPATDLAICVDFDLSESGNLDLLLQEGENLFRLIARPDQLELQLNQVAWPVQKLSSTLKGGQLMLSKIDKQISVSLNGNLVLGPFTYPVAASTQLADAPESPATEQAGLGGSGFTIHRMRVMRDLFRSLSGTWATSKELQLSENEFFLLGDNHRASRDSRHYGPVSKDLLIGNGGMRWLLAGQE